jgi:tryptophanase
MPEIIEPFRIKSVEPIRKTDRAERERLLAEAHWNAFLLEADDVLIDLLTDSGTSAMSAQQWGAIMVGDESYAGSRSFHRFESAVQKIFGFKHVIPTHQGRAAEKILCGLMLESGLAVPNNNHFDTTRANVEFTGAEAVDLVTEEGKDPDSLHPFKGNIDIEKLKAWLAANRGNAPFGMLTITNNAGGGQPVSMKNIRETSEAYKAAGIPFIIDACRFAENAWFIKTREPGYANKTPLEIAQEMFSYADGATMSLKKDGMGNIGGFLALNSDELAEKARSVLILTEGFPTYGGLAGRDLEALAVGLEEVLDESYLEYRIASVKYLADGLQKIGVRIVQPAGGHAVFVDGAHLYPQIPKEQFPAQALVCQLYLEGGIRGVEIGSLMFGDKSQNELVRLALPRRVYTQAHVNYIIEVFEELWAERTNVSGLRLTKEAAVLRHFTAHLEPV